MKIEIEPNHWTSAAMKPTLLVHPTTVELKACMLKSTSQVINHSPIPAVAYPSPEVQSSFLPSVSKSSSQPAENP